MSRTATAAVAGASGALVAALAQPVTLPAQVALLVSPEHQVARVRDGDTLTVPPLDTMQLLYWANRQPEGVRFLCVQAPERGEAGWAEASAWVSTRVGTGEVRLDPDPRPGSPRRDTFGRLLAFVSDVQGSVNLDLVDQGLARFDRAHPCARASEFEQAELRARAAHRGLWQ